MRMRRLEQPGVHRLRVAMGSVASNPWIKTKTKRKKKQPVKTLASLKTASAACAVIGCCLVRSAPAPRSVSVRPKARRGHPGGQSLSI